MSKALVPMENPLVPVANQQCAPAAPMAPSGAMDAYYWTLAGSQAVQTTGQLLHKKSIMTPSTILKGSGFSKLEVDAVMDSSKYMEYKTAQEVTLATMRKWKAEIPAKYHSRLGEAIERLEKGAIEEKYGIVFIRSHDEKKATICNRWIILRESLTKLGRPCFESAYGVLEVAGTKALDYMVVTHTKSSFLSEKTTVNIVPLPANNSGLTLQDTNDILAMVTAFFQTITKE